MKVRRKFWVSLLAGAAAAIAVSSQASAQQQKPNILFIMGDDIGWMQPSIYHRGLMVGEIAPFQIEIAGVTHQNLRGKRTPPAPAPNLLRTTRLFVVAAAIGATASAAVVFSLMDRRAAVTSVAARTLVQPVEPPPPARGPPLMAQLQTQSEQASVSQTQRADASSAMRPQGAAVAAHASSASQAASEPGTPSTTQSPPSAAALAEAPRIMTTEAPPARALVTERSTAAAPGAAPAPAPAPRAVMKKPRAVARAVQPRYDLPRYAAPRYEPRYEFDAAGTVRFPASVRLVRSGILTSGILTTASRPSCRFTFAATARCLLASRPSASSLI